MGPIGGSASLCEGRRGVNGELGGCSPEGGVEGPEFGEFFLSATPGAVADPLIDYSIMRE